MRRALLYLVAHALIRLGDLELRLYKNFRRLRRGTHNPTQPNQ